MLLSVCFHLLRGVLLLKMFKKHWCRFSFKYLFESIRKWYCYKTRGFGNWWKFFLLETRIFLAAHRFQPKAMGFNAGIQNFLSSVLKTEYIDISVFFVPPNCKNVYRDLCICSFFLFYRLWNPYLYKRFTSFKRDTSLARILVLLNGFLLKFWSFKVLVPF